MEFRMYIEAQRFLNRVYATSLLEKIVNDAEAVVSPRDIVRLCKENENCEIILLDNTSIEGILRAVRDQTGKEVYADAEIKIGRITPSLTYSVQTFVQADKLIGFSTFALFLNKFGINGIKELGPSIFRYNGPSTYVAVYLPPILERGSYALLKDVLDNLERRIQKERYVHLPAMNGNSQIDLKQIYDLNRRLYERKKDISFLRDGTHRAWEAMIAGTTIKVVEIDNTYATPTGALVPFTWQVVTREKPKKKEDRFLGFPNKAWLTYTEVGIDG